MKPIRILFTGDSITDAHRTTLNHALGQTDTFGTGYPLFIAARLAAEKPGRFEVLNRGVSGNRIVDLDARVKCDCIHLQPDIVSIMIGINDVWHEIMARNGVDLEKFKRVYTSMLREIQAALPHVRLMLLSPYVLPGTATQEHLDIFQQETSARRAAVMELATAFHAAYLDTQALFDQACSPSIPASTWSLDGVHPTPAGQWLLAEHWLQLFNTVCSHSHAV